MTLYKTFRKDYAKIIGVAIIITFLIISLRYVWQSKQNTAIEYFDNPFPENNLKAFQRANLTPPHGSGQLSTGSYISQTFNDHVDHTVVASLPNPQGGFSVHGRVEDGVYMAWLTDSKSGDAHRLGPLNRDQDGVYRLQLKTINEDYSKYDSAVISYDNDTLNLDDHGLLILHGKLTSDMNQGA